MKYYGSPRWTGEILDCSMPVTFDTYNKCSYNCLYCFSYYQKSHSMEAGGTNAKNKSRGKCDYQASSQLTYVDVKKIDQLLSLDPASNKGMQQFFPYIKDKRVIQWEGLADQFDEYERKNNITYEILKVFKKHNYPLCFSTKATWWLKDERYLELFRNQDNWNCKFSIINMDPEDAKRMERGVDSPQERLKAIQVYSKLNKGGATLRLRPFIIGLSDKNNSHIELIKQASEMGATAVSTEFFCLETRADARLRKRYDDMSEIIGFDIYDFYKEHSRGAGYRRLTRKIKEKYVKEMSELCDKVGLRFYVSDAHFKEYSCNGSCCGLPDDWKYSRGQFTEALVIAKKKGVVYFSDIKEDIEKLHGGYLWRDALGFNSTSSVKRAERREQTMYDYIREMWNTPNNAKSPYKYFEGVLVPTGLDENKDVIYKYNGELK